MLTPGEQQTRAQDISLLEGQRGRVQQQQLAAAEEQLYRDQMAQKAAQFKTEMDWNREQQRRAEEQAEEQKWFNVGTAILPGFGTAVGTAVGRKI